MNVLKYHGEVWEKKCEVVNPPILPREAELGYQNKCSTLFSYIFSYFYFSGQFPIYTSINSNIKYKRKIQEKFYENRYK